jgi:hypothetical protein
MKINDMKDIEKHIDEMTQTDQPDTNWMQSNWILLKSRLHDSR